MEVKTYFSFLKPFKAAYKVRCRKRRDLMQNRPSLVVCCVGIRTQFEESPSVRPQRHEAVVCFNGVVEGCVSIVVNGVDIPSSFYKTRYYINYGFAIFPTVVASGQLYLSQDV